MDSRLPVSPLERVGNLRPASERDQARVSAKPSARSLALLRRRMQVQGDSRARVRDVLLL